MSKAPPVFSSSIPEYLLAEATPRDKWMMENISILTQASVWHTDELCKQTDKIDSIEIQTTKTNGRVTKVEEKLLTHDDQFKKIGEDLVTYQWTRKVIGTKWGVAAVVTIFFVGTFMASYFYHHSSLIPNLLGKLFGV